MGSDQVLISLGAPGIRLMEAEMVKGCGVVDGDLLSLYVGKCR